MATEASAPIPPEDFYFGTSTSLDKFFDRTKTILRTIRREGIAYGLKTLRTSSDTVPGIVGSRRTTSSYLIIAFFNLQTDEGHTDTKRL